MWADPAPRSQSNGGLKDWPCGAGLTDVFEDVPTTTLSPGVQTVLFTETIAHTGSPYRIAFTYESDTRYDSYVLFDHIPHNEVGATPKVHAVNVTIPNVACTAEARCALQLIQVMTDKFTEPCPPSELPNSCGQIGFAYFSCANVIIDGDIPPSSLDPFYASYLGGGPSPYR
eukprot:CAMPEP_0119132348 /NCGR_PEP_ID=MMETSP1310-20130426/11790_1 /TAXON_ID=464262 /ORGANISM="Genus nov. species nov., Strain RCC2339" /LENGTH=171 /DNA_ID=CAMNT_0007122975 /DNA_START=145 /DNA_END=657 /DNA_ORIENTATION=-